MLALRSIETRKWLAGANLLLAAVLVILPVVALPSHSTSSESMYGEGFWWGVAFLACLLIAGLLSLAALGHWWRWRLRWLVQGLAIALPVLGAVFLFS